MRGELMVGRWSPTLHGRVNLCSLRRYYPDQVNGSHLLVISADEDISTPTRVFQSVEIRVIIVHHVNSEHIDCDSFGCDRGYSYKRFILTTHSMAHLRFGTIKRSGTIGPK